MFNNEKFKISTFEKCKMVDDEKHITAKEFKVYIPRLMPNIEMGEPEEEDIDLDVDLLGNDPGIDDTITTANYIEAKSMTDYRSWLFGQVYEMTHSEGATEIEHEEGDDGSDFVESIFPTREHPDDDILDPFGENGVDRPEDVSLDPLIPGLQHIELNVGHVGGTPHAPEPHDNHQHPIEKPFQFFNMKFEELNNIQIEYEKEMIGCFISGDLNDFRITHIPDVIPQEGD